MPPRTTWLLLASLLACGPGWTRNIDIDPPTIRNDDRPTETRTTRTVENNSSSQCSASASCPGGRVVRCSGASRCRGADDRGVLCEQAGGAATKTCCDGSRSCEIVGPTPVL